MPELHRLTAEEFQAADKQPLVAILDNVRSLHNIGAVFRTADAFCLEQIALCGISGCPPNQEMHKTALGAEQTVSWQYFEQTLDAVRFWQEKGYKVYAVEQVHDSQTLEEVVSELNKRSDLFGDAIVPSTGDAIVQPTDAAVVPPKGYAVVFGHEVFGVQQQVVDAVDGCIEIPQYGTKHSLNVSVTAGIVLYSLSNALRR